MVHLETAYGSGEQIQITGVRFLTGFESINVVEQSESSEECLSSSSIMKMPQSVSQHEMIEDKTPSPTASERLTEETLSDISSPANLSFDEVDWQDCPAEQEEYVILYDDSSSDGE